MKGVKHYKKDGTEHTGSTHKMKDGSLHSGKTLQRFKQNSKG